MNASSKSLSNLLKVLTIGQIPSKGRDDLLDLKEVASAMGMSLTNLVLEKTSQKKKTPLTAVTANMTFRPLLDETPANMDTFAAREGSISQWSNNGANDDEKSKVNEESTHTIDTLVITDYDFISEENSSEENLISQNEDKDKKDEGSKIYQCEHCPKKFAGQEYLDMHRESKHTKSTVLKKDTKAPSKKTIQTPIKIKGFDCSICDRTFSNNASLKLHTNIHTKPYKCMKCDKAFSQAGNMKTHMGKCNATQNSISRTESDYCEFCKEYFEFPVELETHMVLMHSINEMILSLE